MDSTSLPHTPGIYKIFFTNPDHFYIGSAIDLYRRYMNHRYTLRKGKHHNIHVQRTYDKYGEETLHFEVIEYVERKEDLIPREQFYLDTLKPHFNICINAKNMLGLKQSEAAKEANRIAHLGKAPGNKGVPIPEERKRYYSSLYKGKPHGHRTNNGKPAWNRGKPAPASAIEKLLNKTPKERAEITTKMRVTKAAKHGRKPSEWSPYYDACIHCKQTTSPNANHGECSSCYYKRKHREAKDKNN